MSKRDYYEVLGVARSATLQEIKKRYRQLAVENHPDRNPGDTAAEDRFKEAAEAYQVLSDEAQRKRYDAYGHAGVSGAAGGFDPGAFTDFGDIFGSLFSDFFGGRQPGRAAARHGSDLRFDMEIDFEEAIRGLETTIRVPRTETCEACGGQGAASAKDIETCSTCRGAGQVRFTQGFFSVSRGCPACHGRGSRVTRPCAACSGHGIVRRERKLSVRLPAGVDSGTRVRLSGEGEAGPRGGSPGDLYVVLHVREHEFFQRDGLDLFCEVPVSFSQAALGAGLTLPTLDGDIEIHLPAGTQGGHRIRVKGKGVPRINGRGRGDLMVRIRVETPRHLSPKARELFKQLAEEEGAATDGPGFFERVRELLH
ncbi:MAG: molecular chaperone DnaJ [Acidobacteriota bacterium]